MAEIYDEIDLAEVIAQTTETKIVLDIPDMQTDNVSAAAADYKNDFDETILETEENNSEKFTENAEKTLYDTSQLAPVIVDGAEMLIKQFFPVIYEKSAFTTDEIIGMKAFAYKQKMQANKRETIIEAGDEKYAAMVEDYENYIESLPLSLAEKKSIIQPLKVVLKDVNYQTSPGNALMISVALVMLPRATPVISKKFFEKKENK